ncbi:MAG: hypothetical protein N4A57_07740 [Anaeromicrobium sp.]|jgi:predicted RNase H-like nuclease (RuvC/YqgF family)|uniref:hypothetical protein n=1 Tax=Anaeromicrobium sp. TaxID=1929132 RepID=UPI0025ED2602|nr:hypothetical protein [Anaeromicrobium sp.]MCT4594141.1 hypothetical protein [Anaeromicrobium sp.]
MISDIKIKVDAYEVVIGEYREEMEKLIKKLSEIKKEYYILEVRKKIEECISGSEKIERISEEYRYKRDEVYKLHNHINELGKVIIYIEKELKGIQKFV